MRLCRSNTKYKCHKTWKKCENSTPEGWITHSRMINLSPRFRIPCGKSGIRLKTKKFRSDEQTKDIVARCEGFRGCWQAARARVSHEMLTRQRLWFAVSGCRHCEESGAFGDAQRHHWPSPLRHDWLHWWDADLERVCKWHTSWARVRAAWPLLRVSSSAAAVLYTGQRSRSVQREAGSTCSGCPSGEMSALTGVAVGLLMLLGAPG